MVFLRVRPEGQKGAVTCSPLQRIKALCSLRERAVWTGARLGWVYGVQLKKFYLQGSVWMLGQRSQSTESFSGTVYFLPENCPLFCPRNCLKRQNNPEAVGNRAWLLGEGECGLSSTRILRVKYPRIRQACCRNFIGELVKRESLTKRSLNEKKPGGEAGVDVKNDRGSDGLL